MRRFFIGVATGATVGYAIVRAAQALRDLQTPAPPLDKDARAYGKLRRRLMLCGLSRSFAGLAATAYGLGPLIETPAGVREPRTRRLALGAAGFALSALFELPTEYVEDFVIERRYALSTRNAGAWLGDYAKSAGVALVLGVPLLELLAMAIDRAPRSWPLLATASSLPLLVLANVVAPTFIAPLFNTFTTLEGEIAETVRALASRYGAGDAALLRVDMSRQTQKANAYVTGLFGTKRIVIGDTLLDGFDPRETLFVVAHELGHYVKRDVWRGVALGTGASAAMFYGSRRLAQRDERTLASSAGLARLFFAMSIFGTALGPLLAAFSRQRERAADRFALAATGDRASGIAAFERLRERNLAEDEQPRWMELLFSSHPSLRRRIERLRAAHG